MGSIKKAFPSQEKKGLRVDVSNYTALDGYQAGHIRHFYNLVAQQDGEWHHMGGLEPMQELFTAYRYQLATMAYGVAATHFHRQPALRSVFKPLFRRIIHKMLRNEVWGYWFLTSHSGTITDPDLKKLRKPWADPVVRENIMYSGHLLLMTSLYAMLFDDDEFEKPDSIVFNWTPTFWGMGPETFKYDNRSLQKAIVAEMEQNNWVGVCCEPNAVFIVCNQFPIIAIHLNDVRDGTQNADDILQEYTRAWDKAGLVQSDGMFVDFLLLKQKMSIPPEGVPHGILPARELGFTAWAGAWMHSWNYELVESLYERQALGYISKTDGQFRIRPTNVGYALRKLVTDHGALTDSAEDLKRAVEEGKKFPPSPIPYEPAMYGIVCQWLSELGKKEELEGVLDYANTHLNGTWENGGFFYPRQDEQNDESGEVTYMEPFSGNSGIGYSRLNVPNGQKIMWQQPWTMDMLSTRPWLDGLTLDNGVDFLRGVWDEAEKALILTARTWDGRQATLLPCARNLPPGKWSAYVGKDYKESRVLEERGSFEIEVKVVGDPVDIVFVQMSTPELESR